MKNIFHALTAGLMFIQCYSTAQSIALNGKSEENGSKVNICEGESLSLKALGFPTESKYEWVIPDQAKKVIDRTKNSFEITLEKALVDYSGDYIVIDKNKGEMRQLTIKVIKKPEIPKIGYVLNDERLVIADESSNSVSDYKFEWILPNESILKSASGEPQNVKQIQILSPKISDLGVYKLTISDKSDACAIMASKNITSKQEKIVDEKKNLVPDSVQNKFFFYGNFGGNIDFINRKLGINSVYTDIQFKPELTINDNMKIKFPIRIYYNNGSGPQQSNNISPQNFTTVDTITLSSTKQVRTFRENPALIYKIENRNIGLNIPISFAYKLPRNENWSVILGLNFDFAWVSNRSFDFSYEKRDSTVTITQKSGSGSVTPPVSVTISVPSNGVTPTIVNSPTFYGTSAFRPRVPGSRENKYSQIYRGVQVGIEHQSLLFDFALKYSLGGTASFFERNSPTTGGYNHIVQLVFLEKTIGLQFFGEIRAANVQRIGDSQERVADSAPYYYFSLSKTIYLSKIKELFFP